MFHVKGQLFVQPLPMLILETKDKVEDKKNDFFEVCGVFDRWSLSCNKYCLFTFFAKICRR